MSSLSRNEWEKCARQQQEEYYDLLGNRRFDKIEVSRWTILRRKVGYGLFGPPTAEPKATNYQTGYTKPQVEHINKICDLMHSRLNFNKHDILFACVYMIGFVEGNQFITPVFKAALGNGTSLMYIDFDCRVYSSWAVYLSKNQLPKCATCYPTNGYYEYNATQDKVQVSFGESPACSLVSSILGGADAVSTVVNLGCTAVTVAAWAIPVAGPIMTAVAAAATTTGVYGVARFSSVLVDRGMRGQNIGMFDSEAGGIWLSILGSSLNMAQGQMVKSMAASARVGDVMGKASRIAFICVQTGNLTLSAAGIVMGAANLVDKHGRGQVTLLDLFQFSSSLLFFANTALDVKTADTIIKDVQRDVLNDMRAEQETPKARKELNKHIGKLRGRHELEGNGKAIKTLNKIANKKEFYAMLSDGAINTREVKLFDTPQAKFGKTTILSPTDSGLLNVNNELEIHPAKLASMGSEVTKDIFTTTKLTRNGRIPKDQFNEVQNKMNMYTAVANGSMDTFVDYSKVRLDQSGGLKVDDEHVLRGDESGMIEFNGELFVHPKELVEMGSEARVAVFSATKEYSDGTLSKTAFSERMQELCSKHKINFENTRSETRQWLVDLHGADKPFEQIQVNGRKIFAKITPQEIDRLYVISKNVRSEFNRQAVLGTVTEFAKVQECSSANEYIKFLDYFIQQVGKQWKALSGSKDTGSARALEKYQGPDKDANFKELSRTFRERYKQVVEENARANPSFFGGVFATYHTVRQEMFGTRTASVQGYFQIAQEILNQETNYETAVLSHDASCVMITYVDPQFKVKAIKIDKCTDNGVVSGIATVFYA